MIEIDHLVSKIIDFPTLPTIYATVSEAVNNPLCSASDIANLISKDQAITAKILKVVNSPIFGMQKSIDTVTQAVVYLGHTEVMNIIMALSIIKIFKTLDGSIPIKPENLWKHSLATAVQSRQIAKTIGIKKLEHFFLAGILHDIGKLTLLKLVPYDYIKTVELSINNKISLRQAELESLGFTSALVGNLLAEKWKLPIYLINAIKGYYNGMINNQFEKLVATVHISDIISYTYGFSLVENEIIPEPNLQVWNYLNLPKEYFNETSNKFVTDTEQMIALMLND